MSEFRVYFSVATDTAVTVDAEDAEDAIEKAYDDGPGGICVHCSGWGQEWSRDEGDELTPYEGVRCRRQDGMECSGANA